VHVPGDLVGARLDTMARRSIEDSVPGADIDPPLDQDAESGMK